MKRFIFYILLILLIIQHFILIQPVNNSSIIVKKIVKVNEYSYEEIIRNNLDLYQDIYWITLTIYFEARNQSELGKELIGFVILNRVKDERFPNSVIDVVFDKNQFSFLWNSNLNLASLNKKAWKECQEVAINVVLGKTKDNSKNATYFHSGKAPYWAKKRTFIFKVGDHYFYSWD